MGKGTETCSYILSGTYRYREQNVYVSTAEGIAYPWEPCREGGRDEKPRGERLIYIRRGGPVMCVLVFPSLYLPLLY